MAIIPAVWLAFVLAIIPAGVQAQGNVVKIGAGVLTEQIILAEMTRLILEETGAEVQTHYGLAPEVLRAALEADRLDVYWEYTGQALVVYQKNPDRGLLVDPEKCYLAVSRADAELNLIWGRPLPANFTYGVLMNRKTAKNLKVGFLSDLAQLLPPEIEKSGKSKKQKSQVGQAKSKAPDNQTQLDQPKDKAEDKAEDQETQDQAVQAESDDQDAEAPTQVERKREDSAFILAMSPEFMERPDGWRIFASRFDLPKKSPGLLQSDPALMFSGLAEGQVDAIIGPVIDSRIILYDLVVIPLPRPFFPAYNPAPVWRAETAKAMAAALTKLDRLSQGLTDAVMSRLAWQVEVDHVPADKAAQNWLKQAGLND